MRFHNGGSEVIDFSSVARKYPIGRGHERHVLEQRLLIGKKSRASGASEQVTKPQ